MVVDTNHSVDVLAPPSEYYRVPPARRSAGVHRSRSRSYQRSYTSLDTFDGNDQLLEQVDEESSEGAGSEKDNDNNDDEQRPTRLTRSTTSFSNMRRRGSADEKSALTRRFLVDIDVIEKAIL
ncbi:hypothetical protein GGI05_005006, partial [Coemansia sp. RSA 2603]